MSLNGLDDARVKEAHEAAVAEAGGWFLLKYASRDEVELLGRGNGGIVEIRNNIAQYAEKSPLYGFLRYRRRNVIIKYLPEECSRLVQARVLVHWTAICDRFSPYDTDFSITDAKELKDTKLSAACSLHAASGSTSSSTSSLRRRRLMEIAEEEEDETREKKRQSVVDEEGRPRSPTRPETSTGTATSPPPVTLNSDLANSPENSQFADRTDPPSFTGVSRPTSPAKSFDDAGRRMSSQSSRPDIYSYSSYPYSKPKVKLGPRPSIDTTTGRPRTSAGSSGTDRPVSALPAGFKLFSKGSKKGRSQDKGEDVPDSPIKEEAEAEAEADAASLAPSIANSEDNAPESEPARPHTSSGAHGIILSSAASIRSNMTSMPPPPTKQNTMTPEKARLLKAMKLREKKKKMSLRPAAEIQPAEESAAEPSPTAPELPPEAHDEESETPAVIPEMDEPAAEDDGHQDDGRSISKADSGIGIDVGTDQASVDTHPDSHPASPTGPFSELGDSTRASSLSESTDETILASKPQDESQDESHDAEDGPAGDEETASVNPEVEQEKVDEEEHVPQIDAKGGDVQPGEHSEDAAKAAKEEEDSAPEKADEKAAESDVRPALSFADDKAVEETSQPTTAPPVPPLLRSKFAATSAQKSLGSGAEELEKSEVKASILTSERPETPINRSIEGETPKSEGSKSQFRIPLSKFSTQEKESKSPTTPNQPVIPVIIAPTPEPTEEHEAVPEAREEEPEEAAGGVSSETKRPKRRAALEPIRTDLDAADEEAKRQSLANLSDDDEFMNELQSATLQQAKHMTVSKSPINPFFPPSEAMTPKRAATGLDSSPSTTPRVVRTVSNPIRGPLLGPGDVSTSSARTVSSGAAFLHKITQQQSAADLRPKSSKIGSSISQRIKALEKLSANSGSPGDTPPKDRPSATFFSVRKAGRDTSRSPSVAGRTSSITRERTPSPFQSGESSPENGKISKRDRSGSMVSRLSVFEGGNLPRGRPESIQVTARIVRDPSHPFPRAPDPKADPTEAGPLDLKQSPLVVDVQQSRSLAPPDTQPETLASLFQRRLSKGSRRSQSEDREGKKAQEDKDDVEESPRPRRRSSLTVVKDFIKDRRDSIMGSRSPSTDNLTNLTVSASSANLLASPTISTAPSRSPSRPPSTHHNLSFPRRLSIGSRRSSLDQSSPALATGNGLSPSITTETSGNESEAEGRTGSSGSLSATTSPNPKSSSASSRASRFMRRLSNSLSSSRKNTTPSISPTVAEEDDAELEAAGLASQSRDNTAAGPTIVAFMGDVNVQFPDTLLWKRRTMCLDSQGFLILSAVQGVTAAVPAAATVKDRHHQAGSVKRYHMSDFKPPYAPEMEAQELPNSVVLDFVDGSGLQIACEDRAGQLNVLHILEEAHQTHTSFGQ